MEIDPIQLNLADVSQRIKCLQLLIEFFHKDVQHVEEVIVEIINSLLVTLNYPENLFEPKTNKIETSDKICLLKLCLQSVFWYLNKTVKNEFHREIINLINSLIRLSMRQGLIVYRSIMNSVILSFGELLNYVSINKIDFEFKLTHFYDVLNLNVNTVQIADTDNTIVVVASANVAHRFLCVFCDILQYQMLDLMQFQMINSDIINDLLACLKIGDFRAKSVAVNCLFQIFDPQRLNGLKNQSSLTPKMVILLANFLIEFSRAVISFKCDVMTIMDSGCVFYFETFEKDYLALFGLLISINKDNDIALFNFYQKIKGLLQWMQNDNLRKCSNVVYWSMISSYCELMTNIKVKTNKDMEFLFDICVKSFDHVSKNIQFERISTFLTSLLTNYNIMDNNACLVFVDKLVCNWQRGYEEFLKAQNDLTVNRFIINSKVMNFVLLKKQSITDSEYLNKIRICHNIRLGTILKQSLLISVVNNCEEGSLKLLELLSIFIEEFCVSLDSCKYSTTDWKTIVHLIVQWYFKEEPANECEESVSFTCDKFSDVLNLNFNRNYSYFLLSFLPNDDFATLKSNILRNLWGKSFEEVNLQILFESFRNNIICGSNPGDLFHIIESLYYKYKDDILINIKLIKELFLCLHLLHCRVCNNNNTKHTIKTRTKTEIYYPINIFIDITCVACSNQIPRTEFQTERRELQKFIISFILDILKDIIGKQGDVNYQSDFKYLMMSIVNHCSWNWKEESILTIVSIIKSVFTSNDVKLQYDMGSILLEFAKKLAVDNRLWPMIQQNLATNFEEILDKKLSSIEPVVYALKSLLKVVPFRFIELIMRLIFKIIFLYEKNLPSIIHNMLKRVVLYRKINEEQLFKQCISAVVESVCNVPEIQQSTIHCFCDIFNLSYVSLYKILLPHLFIYFVLKGGKESHLTIQKLLMLVTWVTPTDNHFNRMMQTIVIPESIVYFFVNVPRERFNEIRSFFNSHFGNSLEKLVSYNDITRTIHLFMLHLSDKPNNVYAGLKWIALDVVNVEEIPDRMSLTSDFGIDKISDFLRSHSVGILDFFKNQLLNSKLTFQEHERVISSLEAFIKLVKSGLKNIHIMCFSILKICLKFTNTRLVEKSYATWTEFLSSLDCTDLETVLVESIAVLLHIEKPLLGKIKDILNYIFSKTEQLKTKICDLHFILEFPGLNDYHNKLKKIISEDKSPDNIFIPVLKCSIRNFQHDNSCVRQLSATHLFTVLSTNIEKLSGLITIFKQENETNTDNMDLIHDLNHSLISAITKEYGNNKIIFARCLGLLGAVDPGRFRELTFNNTNSKPIEFVTSPNFSFGLLCELGKVYLGVTTTNQMDASAMSIQELLKTFNVPDALSTGKSSIESAPDEKNSCSFNKLVMGTELWDMFPSQIKEIFQPFLKSKYILMQSIDWSYITLPILTSSDGMQLDHWICTWTGYLVHLMKNSQHISVFSHTKILIKNDPKFSKFILPHVILALLIENDSSVSLNINSEIVSIFHAICSGNNEDGSHLRVEKIINNSSSLILSPGTQNSQNRDKNQILQSAGQIIFSVLDYLELWLNMIWDEIMKNKSVKEYDSSSLIKNHEIVKSFVKSIPHKLLARTSHKCGSLARSIKQWMLAYRHDFKKEASTAKKDKIRKEITMGLLQAHAAINNSDEISGYLSTFKSDLEPFAQTLKLEYEGKYDLALSIYEQELLEQNKNNYMNKYGFEIIDIFRSIFRCQLYNISALPSVIGRAECFLNDENFPIEHYESINYFRIEALYKIGDWKRLEESLSLEDDNHDNWTISVTKALCQAKNEKHEIAQTNLETIWKKTITNLEISTIEGFDYERVYNDISRFAMLTEIEIILANKDVCEMNTKYSNIFKYLRQIRLKDIPDFFNQRYELSETNFVSQESLLTSHYNLFQLILEAKNQKKTSTNESNLFKDGINQNIGRIWLQRCKIARRAGQFSSAMACLLHVERLDFIEFSIEKGKLFWKMGRLEESLNHLDQVIEYLTPQRSGNRFVTKHKYKLKRFPKLLLLRARLSDLTCRYDFTTTQELYKSVFEFENQSEVAHFRLAHFLDESLKLTKDYKEETLTSAVTEYGLALKYGSRFVYQSMPRLLSLWLDKNSKARHMSSINSIMKTNIKVIPKFQFYIALSQILSRLCNENNREILELLCDLVVKIFLSFPQQTIWSLISLDGSSFNLRRERFDFIVEKIKNQKKEMSQFIYKMVNLSKTLREISELDETSHGQSPINLKKCGKSLAHLLTVQNFSDVIIPLHHQLFGTLPTPATFRETYSPFPSKSVCIANIDDSVEVLQSLTKPKKMFWWGTDGQKYIIVAKPKDDMRRDCRIMELNGMFNRLMRRNSETRHRLLYIRTYAVTPLGEKCGLIEWVNNTEGFRNIILNLHNQRNNNIIWAKINLRYPLLEDPPEKKYSKFINDIIPMYPVIFYKWFLQKFPEPSSWYRSLQRYSRSLAVMSMVGYILGLGDRHIENILFDCKTGDTVHIDFNCLFNHGRTLQWPEVVPFRLTRNMQDALGPCGSSNGLFRSSCVATLKLLRDEIEPIMAVFSPMYYDTLTEIKDPKINKSNRQVNAVSLTENKLEEMENRLKGKVNQLPLSVEGVVNYLIAQAIDDKLLCQMYIGWGSFM